MKHHLPKRIILVRHGECEADEDMGALERVPNHQLKLIEKGINQARMAALKIKEIVSDKGTCENWKVSFFVSPSRRARETVEEMIGMFPTDSVIGVREECRVREQFAGNFQNVEEMLKMKRERNIYGKFFYKYPHGESAADVYDRVSSFVEGRLWRESAENVNLIVVSHGLTVRLLLMKLLKWSVDEFEGLNNPLNCECRVLQLGRDGEYSLAHHHKLDELRQWGLSDQMIHDQGQIIPSPEPQIASST